MTQKILILIVFIAVVVALYVFTPVRQYLSPEGVESLKVWITGLGPWGPLAFIALYVFTTVFCIPASVMTLAAGALFGVWLGTLYVVIASNLGANAAFFIARYLGQETASKFLRGRLQRLDTGVEQGGFLWVFILRLIPAVPFVIFNYAAGLTSVKWRDYALANVLGMLPGTFVYVSLGSAVGNVGKLQWSDPKVWGPFVLVIVFTVVLKAVEKKRKARGKV